MSIPTPFDTLTSGLASIVRLPAGTTVREDIVSSANYNSAPRLIKLYDVENDPKCRMVREYITELDLIVENVIPCGKDSVVWEEDLVNLTQDEKKAIIPRLVVIESQNVVNVNVLQGLDEILEYLEEQFDPSMTSFSSLERFETRSTKVPKWRSLIASFLRSNRGTSVTSSAITKTRGSLSNQNKKPLVLYSYEGNQFCRLVREVLTELDLNYELRSAGKDSPRREELANLSGGSTQCPFLVDPNTKVKMNESKDIIAYLYSEYAEWTPPNEFLQSVSSIITPVLRPFYKILAPIQAGRRYDADLVRAQIQQDVTSYPVVVYTYTLSPFCTEATDLLQKLGVPFQEISLGSEWLPFLIDERGAEIRAELGYLTGQTSLPHIFVGGESIGGLFSGNPGLIPALESKEFFIKVEQVTGTSFTANNYDQID